MLDAFQTMIRDQLFGAAYLRQGDDFWRLTPRERQREFIRELARLAPSIPLAKRVDDPLFRFFATLSADDIDAALHYEYPQDDYPIANFDPLGRRQRWP
jgi:hypothetical protein